MSRLIIKNLPPKITEAKLRSTFSAKGAITDLQLKYTKDGTFRGFAFIGFKTEEEAEAARRYFQGTYIGAAKIDVQPCADLGDSQQRQPREKFKDKELPKPDDKKAKDKEKKKNKKEVKSILEKYKDDPKFQEFLQAHKHSGGEAWTNDSVVEVANLYTGGKENEGAVDDSNAKVEDKEEKLVEKKVKKHDFYHVKLSNLPYKFKKKHVKAFLEPLKPPSVRVPPKIHGIAFVGFKTEKERNQALNKHKSLYEGQQIFVYKYEQKESSDKVSETNRKSSKWAEQEAGIAEAESVGESGRIFVRNLSYAVTEDELQEMFSKYGPLTEVNLPVDKITRRSKGFAFITYMMPEHAVLAFSELDGSSYQGRLLHLIPGKVKEGGEEGVDETAGYKKKKEQEKKSTAGSSHNWNALFLGSSAVADLMSEKYNVDKADVVLGDSGGKSAAVRLALGETQIIQETKKYLEEEGIKLEVFEKPPKVRSKTVIIAKNLPANTSGQEIRDMFCKFGVLGRVVMPPGGITAVIEFADPGEARTAFTNLAYTRFHNTPLYLEWAPEETFTTAFSEGSVRKVVETKPDESSSDEKLQDLEAPEPDTTLFIKNLNFDTTDEGLKNHFSKSGDIFSANVAIKKDLKSGDKLSMGFGFVTYWRKSSADQALKSLQHSRLDSHALELKRSNRAAEKEKNTSKKEIKEGKPSTKLLVRNVAFQATKQEVTEIFKTYGELSSVRLPTKMSGTGSHRGFAFVEFESKSDAKKAMEELSGSTHLYGRRLVLEWAEQDDSLDSLRKRTADQFNAGSLSATKRTKNFEISDTSADVDE